MKQKSIRIVIMLAAAALVAVIVMQFFWVNKSLKTQDDQVVIQKRNLEIQKSLTDQKVKLALTQVRDNLISLNDEASAFYLEPVLRITHNYYVVSFYDTLNPELLKTYLVEEFEKLDLVETFQYGIYDCFKDSIVFDNYVQMGQELLKQSNVEVPNRKWEHDGHYFGVFFPNMVSEIPMQLSDRSYSLIISSIIIALIVVTFAVAISVILRQKKLSEVRNDFINNMTHELKTPISTIGLSSEVLLRDDIAENPERINQYARIIRSENKRLESQVERVLQLAQLEKKDIALNLSIFNLHDVIYEVCETFSINIEQREGKLSQSLSATESQVKADPVHITNVISNLLDNANKYSPNKPEISISTGIKGKMIAIYISDKGKGMSKEELKNVFDKFYRVPTGDVHDVKGFGLGLYYVKTILEEHKGSIKISSVKGEGSTVTVLLPIFQLA